LYRLKPASATPLDKSRKWHPGRAKYHFFQLAKYFQTMLSRL